MIAMRSDESSGSSLGRWAALGVFVTGVLYVTALGGGFASLDSAQDPIGDPWFTILELLILTELPLLVMLFSALHMRTPVPLRPYSLAALIFICTLTTISASVHFSILTLSRTELFQQDDISRALFAFEWPSVAYALDILAWDGLFPLALFCIAATFSPTGREKIVRRLVLVSAWLSLAGLAGVVFADMQLRNIGILGYGMIWPLAALAMVGLFKTETRAVSSEDALS
ncbi:hypothetical protein [Altererythrobacter lutimaris]|uniref:DUF4386 family protein n=1 Tax=Altererythrobacter lutimaris TaxID=2743979 RepID=A0A850HCP9_9SPHN|nr:hypothetical protein [Altererythrobacter lutimaris]NVE95519.1 hypothetical protein [Altererythrobacter lutimaris]